MSLGRFSFERIEDHLADTGRTTQERNNPSHGRQGHQRHRRVRNALVYQTHPQTLSFNVF